MSARSLVWKHGVFAVDSLGGMLGRGAFLLPDGRQVSPFYVAPWWNEARAGLDGLTQGLRGEWPCVPFGYPARSADVTPRWAALSDDSAKFEFAHGYGSNHEWEFTGGDGSDHLAMSIRYPESDDIERLDRILRPVPDAAAIDFELIITARRDTAQPVSLHACFALPPNAGDAELRPGKFAGAVSYPAIIAKGATLFATDAEFSDLTQAPGIDGKPVDATRLPLDRPVEDLVQLNGADGTASLINRAGGYRVDMGWDAETLPSLIVWYSNRGRDFAPWDGRNLCVGIEPCSTAFGLSPALSAKPNPISEAGTPTAVSLKAGEPLSIRYRIGVAPL